MILTTARIVTGGADANAASAGVCGYQKHVSLHGGVIDKPGFIFDHEFSPKHEEFALCQECKTQIKCASQRKCDRPIAYGNDGDKG